MTEEELKKKAEHALVSISDLALNFVAYDRKDDDELSSEDVEELFETGTLTPAMCAAAFQEALREHLGLGEEEDEGEEDFADEDEDAEEG